MRIILHIGTEKTGTTTIQEFLHVNRDRLLSDGILVPLSPNASGLLNHRKLAVYGCNDTKRDDGRVKLGITSSSEFRAQFERDFVKECLESGCDTVVLSSEHCSSRLRSNEEIERVKTLLDQVGQTTILLYLRPQEEMWKSWYSTSVSIASCKPFSAPTRENRNKLLDYHALCCSWATAFGTDSLRVRIFAKDEFVDQNLLRDFVSAAGLTLKWDGIHLPPQRNTSINLKLLEFLRRFNVYLPHMSKRTKFHPDPLQGDLIKILRRLSQRMPPDVLSREQLEWTAEFSEGNANVARIFLGRDDGVLFRDDNASVRVDTPPPQFNLDDAFEIFAKIWSEKNRPQQNR